MADEWKDRIIETGVQPASSFLANPLNWRIHPKPQQDGTQGSLDALGWVQRVLVNKRTSEEWGADQNVETVINGHLRITLALRKGDDTPVPVDYVDLSPNEEVLALTLLDSLTVAAGTDSTKLKELLELTQSDNKQISTFLEGLAVRQGLMPAVDYQQEWQGMPEYGNVEMAFKSISVHFESQENIDQFADLIDQNISEKTKYIWFPKKERQDLKSLEFANES